MENQDPHGFVSWTNAKPWKEMDLVERLTFVVCLCVASVLVCIACAGIVFGFFDVIGHPIQ